MASNIVDIFATNIEKEARALICFMDLGDLNVELLRLTAKRSTEVPSIEEIKAEQIQIVRRAIELLKA